LEFPVSAPGMRIQHLALHDLSAEGLIQLGFHRLLEPFLPDNFRDAMADQLLRLLTQIVEKGAIRDEIAIFTVDDQDHLVQTFDSSLEPFQAICPPAKRIREPTDSDPDQHGKDQP